MSEWVSERWIKETGLGQLLIVSGKNLKIWMMYVEKWDEMKKILSERLLCLIGNYNDVCRTMSLNE